MYICQLAIRIVIKSIKEHFFTIVLTTSTFRLNINTYSTGNTSRSMNCEHDKLHAWCATQLNNI